MIVNVRASESRTKLRSNARAQPAQWLYADHDGRPNFHRLLLRRDCLHFCAFDVLMLKAENRHDCSSSGDRVRATNDAAYP